jgi:hypothetical protein
MLKAFGPVALTPAQLEPLFLYANDDPRPQDVIRQGCSFLESLGFLEPEGAGKYRRVSGKLLKDGLTRCQEWLAAKSGESFDKYLAPVKAVHEEAANQLALRAKELRDLVGQTLSRIAALSLKFLDSSWSDLDEIVPDPLTGRKPWMFQVEFCKAAATVAEARRVVDRVFDPHGFKELSAAYSPDLLPGFEVDRVRNDYPLWKRVAILSGFYSEMGKLRTQLLQRIKEHMRRGHDEMEDGEEGQKAYPTQVLTNALKVWKEELTFPSNEPHRSVRFGGGSLGATALGVKLAQGKYREAWKRLEELEQVLTQPNEIPQRYFVCVDRWRSLITEQRRLGQEVESWRAFFVDATEDVRTRFHINELIAQVQQFADDLWQGVRDGTDERESAGHSIFELIDGLEADLAGAQNTPQQISSRLQGLKPGVLEALVQEFESGYRDILGAYTRVRTAQSKSQTSWPSSLAESYGSTRQLFEQLVSTAQGELRQYFADVKQLSWEDFVGLCKVDAEGRDIPWDQEPYRDYVGPLQRKGLVRLKLI